MVFTGFLKKDPVSKAFKAADVYVMPSLSEPPSGCRFHTRCHRFLGDICVEQEPPLQEPAHGHTYKCHIPPQELLAAQATTEAVTPTGG